MMNKTKTIPNPETKKEEPKPQQPQNIIIHPNDALNQIFNNLVTAGSHAQKIHDVTGSNIDPIRNSLSMVAQLCQSLQIFVNTELNAKLPGKKMTRADRRRIERAEQKKLKKLKKQRK